MVTTLSGEAEEEFPAPHSSGTRCPFAMPRILPRRSIMCGPAYTLHKCCSGSVSRRIPLTMLPWLRVLPEERSMVKTSYFFRQHVFLVGQAFSKALSPSRSRQHKFQFKTFKRLASSRGVHTTSVPLARLSSLTLIL